MAPALLMLVYGALLLPLLAVGLDVPGLGGFVLSGLVWALLLAALVSWPSSAARLRTFCRWLFWMVLVALLLLRWSWALVLDFSGEGFTTAYFAHLSMTSALVGVSEYWHWLGFALLTSGWVALMVHRRLGQQHGPAQGSWTAVLGMVSLGLLLAAVFPARGPEAQWLENFQVFREMVNPGTLTASERDYLSSSGLVHVSGTHRQDLEVSPAVAGRNLILVYLESFHLAFTDEGPLDDLTPGINALKEKYGFHPAWLSSADATMEGLISTLCGTLVASAQGSSGFVNRDSILPDLACLPDVLALAGYHQVYLGGFDKAFSGKELFLADHGFDEIYGWEDWQGQGFQAPVRNWGLPDEQLFEQAVEKIRTLNGSAEQQPFNLMMLTLGTHPPGFPGDGCKRYPGADSSRIVQAVHCTDQLLTRFVDTLQREGLLANSLLVITSDHDMFNLPELKAFFPGMARDPRLLHLVIHPEQEVSWPEHPSIGADLAPTLLQLLNIEHNTRFMWGRPAWEQREQWVTRNFRTTPEAGLTFLENGQPCEGRPVDLAVPLNDCGHRQLLRLSDRFLYSFFGEHAAPAALCTATDPFQLLLGVDAGLSLVAAGKQQDKLFIHRGRAMQPDEPGFYLYIKPSRTRVAGHYYFPLDHVYRQIKLTELLLSLGVEDQFVLAYLPGEHPPLIGPLREWLQALGLQQPRLDRLFAVVANGQPARWQAQALQGEQALSLALERSKCERIAAVADESERLLDKAQLAEQLRPLQQQYPDL